MLQQSNKDFVVNGIRGCNNDNHLTVTHSVVIVVEQQTVQLITQNTITHK